MRTTIRQHGKEPVAVETSPSEVKILHGHQAIMGTIYLDWGEARELAEAILVDFAEMSRLTEGRHEGL